MFNWIEFVFNKYWVFFEGFNCKFGRYYFWVDFREICFWWVYYLWDLNVRNFSLMYF